MNDSAKSDSVRANQLNESLHCTLASERQDLTRFAEIAERMRSNSKSVNGIREKIKGVRDRMNECVESLKNTVDTTAEFQTEMNKLSIDLQFSDHATGCPISGNQDNVGSDGFPVSNMLATDNSTSSLGQQQQQQQQPKKAVHELNNQQMKKKLAKILSPTMAAAASANSASTSASLAQQTNSNTNGEQSKSALLAEMSLEDVVESNSIDEDMEILLYLVKIAEKFQMNLTERLNTLCKCMDESVSQDLNRFVKGPIKESRYEAKEFFSKLNQYHDSIRNLNAIMTKSSSHSTAASGNNSVTVMEEYPLIIESIETGGENEAQGANGANGKSKSIKSLFGSQSKQFDIKRYVSLRDSFEASKENLIDQTESCFLKFEHTEIEWETGVFPLRLLAYMKQMRSFFQSGLDACNELLPVEMVGMLESALATRRKFRKVHVEMAAKEIRSSLDKSAKKKDFERSKSQHSLHAVPKSPPPPPLPIVTTAATVPDIKVFSGPPSFAPPPPPKQRLEFLQANPPTPPSSPSCTSSSPLPLLQPTRFVEVPEGLGSDTRKLLQDITDPNMEFLYTFLKNKSVPLPNDIKQFASPSVYDCIQRCIQLVTEAGLSVEWSDILTDHWKGQILIPNYQEFTKGEDIWKLVSTRDSSHDRRKHTVEMVYYHLLWSHSKHYLQKCVNELFEVVTEGINFDNGLETIDWINVLRKSCKIIMGHRGLITSNFRLILSNALSLLDLKEPIEINRAIGMILFHQLILPAMKSMPQLISYWKSNPHTCVLSLPKNSSSIQTDFPSLPPLYDEIIERLSFILKCTLCYVLELPLASSGNELVDIRMQPLAMQVAYENSSTFSDYFTILSKPKSLIKFSPDFWMIETRAQEWLTLYSDNISS